MEHLMAEFVRLHGKNVHSKLNKKEMNGVYVHACKKLNKSFAKLEILIALHEYFDLDIEKFYKSISKTKIYNLKS